MGACAKICAIVTKSPKRMVYCVCELETLKTATAIPTPWTCGISQETQTILERQAGDKESRQGRIIVLAPADRMPWCLSPRYDANDVDDKLVTMAILITTCDILMTILTTFGKNLSRGTRSIKTGEPQLVSNAIHNRHNYSCDSCIQSRCIVDAHSASAEKSGNRRHSQCARQESRRPWT